MPKFRTIYDRSPSPGVTFDLPSRTKQSFKEDCDVNNIMRRYQDTGVITHVNSGEPIYGDFSEVADYQKSLHIVMEAEERFMSLPAEVRKRFDNDPAVMLEFIQNPANRKECEELGFLVTSSDSSTGSSSFLHEPEADLPHVDGNN